MGNQHLSDHASSSNIVHISNLHHEATRMVDQGDDTTMKSFDMTRNKNDQLSILDHTEYEQLMDFRSRMDQM